MSACRDAVIRELKERSGVRAIAHAPPKYDSTSAGMVENAIKQVKEKVRTMVIATRALHGVVVNLEDVALAWCVRFAGHFPYCERRGWAHCIATCVSAWLSSTSHACSMGRKDLVLGSEQEESSDHRQIFRRNLLGHQRSVLRSSLSEHLVVVWYAELSASVEHPGDCCQKTNREKPENNRCESMYVLCILTFYSNHQEPAKPRRVYIRNSVGLARYGYIP